MTTKWEDIKASKIPPDQREAQERSSRDFREAMNAPTRARFRALCREILAEGRVPFPTELSRRMGWRGQPNMISGHYSGIRIEELRAAGWRKDENAGKWVRP